MSSICCLPLADGLFEINSFCGCFVIFDSINNYFSVSSTDISKISCLTGLLQLAGKHGNRNSDKDSDDRDDDQELCESKTTIVLFQVFILLII